MLAWNNTYPEEAIFYDDVGVDALFERIEKKYEKRQNP